MHIEIGRKSFMVEGLDISGGGGGNSIFHPSNVEKIVHQKGARMSCKRLGLNHQALEIYLSASKEGYSKFF